MQRQGLSIGVKFDYLELLDATARITRADKAGATPMDVPPIIERLNRELNYWKLLIKDFGRVFSLVAGLCGLPKPKCQETQGCPRLR